MSYIPFHPAPGLGDLVPGFHIVPQNPIRDAGTPMKASLQGAFPNQIIRRPRIGEILLASFTVPQNPIVNTLTRASRGMGCSGGCGSRTGMGTLSDVFSGDQSITDWFTSPNEAILNLPNWAVLAGAAVVAIEFMGYAKKGRHR